MKIPAPYELTPVTLRDSFPLLTPSEGEVLRWILHAKTDPEIAGIMDLRNFTVSTHVRRILDKLCVENRLAAALEAVTVVICRRPPFARQGARRW